MILVLGQAVLSLLAGWGVFVLWRRIASTSRAVFWLVTAGLLIRAVGGQLAFWISYLSLPIGRSVQLGNGLWVFAADAQQYLPFAESLAHLGPGAIIHVLKINASVFYTQTLATAILLFGSSAATALLLNIVAFLGCCRIALLFGDPRKHMAVVVAIAALSLAPSAILWSLQPLKDIFFLFVVGSFFAAALLWQRLWIDGRTARSLAVAAVGAALGMAATLYAVSSIRWYFGVILVVAAVPFVVLTAVRAVPRRLAAAGGAAVLAPLLIAAFYFGAGPHVPDWMIDAVVKRDFDHQIALPGHAIEAMNTSRQGFENSGGATIIGAGKTVKSMDASLGVEERHVAAKQSLLIAPSQPIKREEHPQELQKRKPRPAIEKEADIRTTTAATVTAPPPNTVPADTIAAQAPATSSTAAPKTAAPVADSNAASVRTAASGSKTAAPAAPPTNAATSFASATQPTQPSTPPITQHAAQPEKADRTERTGRTDQTEIQKTSKSDTPQKADIRSNEANKPASVAPPHGESSNAEAPTPRPRHHRTRNRKSAEPPAAPVQKPTEAVIAPAPAVVAVKPVAPPQPQRVAPRETVEGGSNAGTVSLPAAPVSRLLVGTAAIALPRFLAQRLGILEVRGGRGLWLLIELDTLFFDAILVFTLVSLVQAARRRNMNAPLFWMLLIVTACIGGALAYTVTNFGTLFRHRDMLMLALVLLPLGTLAASREPLTSHEPDAHVVPVG